MYSLILVVVGGEKVDSSVGSSHFFSDFIERVELVSFILKTITVQDKQCNLKEIRIKMCRVLMLGNC